MDKNYKEENMKGQESNMSKIRKGVPIKGDTVSNHKHF